MYVCMYGCMYVCVYVCMYVCMYVPMYVYMCVCVCVCMYVCICVCMYVCMYVCMDVCILYVCMYVCSPMYVSSMDVLNHMHVMQRKYTILDLSMAYVLYMHNLIERPIKAILLYNSGQNTAHQTVGAAEVVRNKCKVVTEGPAGPHHSIMKAAISADC